MAYIQLSKNFETLIYEERTDSLRAAPLGTFLFDFLELDLEEYDQVYNLVNYQRDFEKSDLYHLIQTYPRTTNVYKYIFKNIDELDDDPDTLREYSIYFLYDNRDTFHSIYLHPYIQDCDIYLDGISMNFADTIYDANWKEAQKSIMELIDFCFINHDMGGIDDLTPVERYHYFCMTNMKKYKYIIKLHSTPFFSSNHHTETNNELIQQIKGIKDIFLVGECLTVKDFAFWEFYTILEKKANIKKCKNCGRYFISKGDYATDYCDRIPEGEKFSCKKLAAIKARKNKVQNNPVLKEYEKAYKRMYARLSNRKISNEDFRLWVEEASQKRDRVSILYTESHSNDLIGSFKKYLGNK